MWMMGKVWFKIEFLFLHDSILRNSLFSDIETMERFEAHARSMEKLMPWINESSQSHKDSIDGNKIVL